MRSDAGAGIKRKAYARKKPGKALALAAASVALLRAAIKVLTPPRD
jgi:hypothetical protein